MATRSLNKVILIGNLTRDPELRYTPSGTAVCTFGLATNRQWTTQSGEVKEDAEFHRIVAWNKLGELCAQLLSKGRKVYVEGRLSTHSWTAPDGAQRSSTEIVIEDMIILDSRRVNREEGTGAVAAPPIPSAGTPAESTHTETVGTEAAKTSQDQEKTKKTNKKSSRDEKKEDKKEEKGTGATDVQAQEENITPDDIPF